MFVGHWRAFVFHFPSVSTVMTKRSSGLEVPFISAKTWIWVHGERARALKWRDKCRGCVEKWWRC